MPKGRALKPVEIEKVRELSKTHYPDQIAKIMGLTPDGIRRIQKRIGVDGKRKSDKIRMKLLKASDKEQRGYFDIDKWAKLMAV